MDAVADSLDDAGEVGAEPLAGWLGQSESGSGDVRGPGEGEPVERVGRRSSNADQDIGITDLGFLDVVQFEDIRRAISVVNDLHRYRVLRPPQAVSEAPGPNAARRAA